MHAPAPSSFAFIGPAATGEDPRAGGLGPHFAKALGARFYAAGAADTGATLLAGLAPGERPVIDGACLERFGDLAEALAAREAVGLIQFPRSGARPALAGLHRIVTTGEPAAHRLVAEFAVAAERVSVVQPGTDRVQRRTIDGTRPEGTPCDVLAVGAITPRKGHAMLLRALACLTDLDWRLTIAGRRHDAEEEAGLKTLAGALGIAPRVTVLAAPEAAALEAAWQRADVFALASRFEAYPLAVAEALRRGLPMALTEAAACGLVPPEAGALVAGEDLAQYGRALRRLIFSPALRAICAEASFAAGSLLPDWDAAGRAFAAAIG